MGWIIFRLWHYLPLPLTGGPDEAPFPNLWPWFFSIFLPAIFPCFSLLLHLLRPYFKEKNSFQVMFKKALKWDWISYGMIPLFILLMIGGKVTGHWRLPLAGFYMSILFYKVVLLIITFYSGFIINHEDREFSEDHPSSGLLFFLIPFLLYVFVGVYLNIAMSTAGDEQLYLINVHSLYADGDLDTKNSIERGDYKNFYWGRPGPLDWWSQKFPGFSVLLYPGYAITSKLFPHYHLAGRLGATLTIVLFGALFCLQIYRICCDLNISRPASFWAWIIIAMFPPVLTFSNHIYPEIPNLFLIVIGLRIILRMDKRPWSGILIVFCVAITMSILKARYLPISIGLIVWSMARLIRYRPYSGLLFIAGVMITGSFFFSQFSIRPYFFQQWDKAGNLQNLLSWDRYKFIATIGVLADQQVGLLFYNPHLSLTFVGIIFLWQRQRNISIGLLGLTIFYLIIISQAQGYMWHGGWNPTVTRYVLPITPLLIPFVAEAFEHCRGKVLAVTNTIWLFWSGSIAFVLCLIPFWRYSIPDGRSTIIRVLGNLLQLDLARFLPSLIVHTIWTWIILGIWLVALIFFAIYHKYFRLSPNQGWGKNNVIVGPVQLGIFTLGLMFLWLGAAVVIPTRSLEAAGMLHSGGIRYDPNVKDPILWVMKENGEIYERIVTWPGTTEITITAGGNKTNESSPKMTLYLDNQLIKSWDLKSGRKKWIEGKYIARGMTSFARPILRLEFTNLSDDPATDRRLAYIGGIVFQRVDIKR
jgi:hypothetical protein